MFCDLYVFANAEGNDADLLQVTLLQLNRYILALARSYASPAVLLTSRQAPR